MDDDSESENLSPLLNPKNNKKSQKSSKKPNGSTSGTNGGQQQPTTQNLQSQQMNALHIDGIIESIDDTDTDAENRERKNEVRIFDYVLDNSMVLT